MPVAANAPGARGELQTSAGRCDHLNADLRAFSVQAIFEESVSARSAKRDGNTSSVDERVDTSERRSIRLGHNFHGHTESDYYLRRYLLV